MLKRLQTVLCLALAAAGGFAHSQPYPAKAIRIVVPFPAGGTTDIAARIVAQRMQESMGQPVLVENRAGAGGTIGADAVAKSAPDGYTLLMHNITFPLASTSLALAGRLPYNLDTDFAGVSIVVNVPLVLTANPAVPVKDLRELAALLKKDASLKYTYGSTGPGSFMNVIGEAFKKEAGVDMTHIPFKGAAPLKQELLAGRLHVGGDQLSSSLAEIKSGKLKALATHGARRIPELPDVPTVRELGYPLLELEGWNGLFVAAKTPKDIIDRLHREAVAAARHPDSVKRFADLAAEAVGSTPASRKPSCAARRRSSARSSRRSSWSSALAAYATRLMLAQALFSGAGAELGVAGGSFSEDILRYCPAVTLLWSIDRWSDHHDLREYWSAADRLADYGLRSRVRRCTFAEAAQMIADGSLGWCFIDGYAHTGQDGMQTLAEWWRKLRPGGILSGHDYHPDWPATMQVVDEFVASHGLALGVTREYDKARNEWPSWWVRKP